jgi:hypothetical protein
VALVNVIRLKQKPILSPTPEMILQWQYRCKNILVVESRDDYPNKTPWKEKFEKGENQTQRRPKRRKRRKKAEKKKG